MASRKDISKLKAEWLADPCWDIEDTEGFEADREELIAFSKEQYALWEAERNALLFEKSVKLGCPGNLSLAAYIELLEDRIIKLENKQGG